MTITTIKMITLLHVSVLSFCLDAGMWPEFLIPLLAMLISCGIFLKPFLISSVGIFRLSAESRLSFERWFTNHLLFISEQIYYPYLLYLSTNCFSLSCHLTVVIKTINFQIYPFLQLLTISSYLKSVILLKGKFFIDFLLF